MRKFNPNKYQITCAAVLDKLGLKDTKRLFMHEILRRIGSHNMNDTLEILNLTPTAQELEQAKSRMKDLHIKSHCTQCQEWGAIPDGKFTICFNCYLINTGIEDVYFYNMSWQEQRKIRRQWDGEYDDSDDS